METRCFVKHENVRLPEVSYQGELFGFYCATQMVQKLEGLRSYAAVVFQTVSNEVAEQMNGIGRLKIGYEEHFVNEIADARAVWSSLQEHGFEVTLSSLQEHGFEVTLSSIHRDYNKVSDALAKYVKGVAQKQGVYEGRHNFNTHDFWTSKDGFVVNLNDVEWMLEFLSDEERCKNNF